MRTNALLRSLHSVGAVSFAAVLAACGGSNAPADPGAPSGGDAGVTSSSDASSPGAGGLTDAGGTGAPGTGAPDGSTSGPVTGAQDSGAGGIDPRHLPIGDKKYSTTTPAVGMVYSCMSPAGGGGAAAKGPWFNADGATWNSLTKLVVQGAVTWTSSFTAAVTGATLTATGNGLPSHATGTFPVAAGDPIHPYDGNPNSIKTANLSWALTANPTVAAAPTCLGMGAVGVFLTGARLYNALDAEGRDAVAWEGQDLCQGHPQGQGQYHYHSLSTCAVTDTPGQHSPLAGYAADGFGVFGNLGEGGAPLTNRDLDECHGHTHPVSIRGATVTQYHYHATREYPYTVGCFRGTPVTIK